MNKSVELKYAVFWVRVGAAIIDSILIVLVTFPILWSIYGSEYFKSAKIINGFWDFIISWVFPAIAVVVFWIYRSATPGKIALGLKIIDADTGEKPGSRQCIIRYLGYYVSAIPLFLGLIWVAFDDKKQGWHDKLAGTYVVIDK